MAKIVNTCNFDGDYPNESFLPIPVLDEEAAQTIADAINKFCANSRYWKVVPNNYVLKPGFEP